MPCHAVKEQIGDYILEYFLIQGPKIIYF